MSGTITWRFLVRAKGRGVRNHYSQLPCTASGTEHRIETKPVCHPLHPVLASERPPVVHTTPQRLRQEKAAVASLGGVSRRRHREGELPSFRGKPAQLHVPATCWLFLRRRLNADFLFFLLLNDDSGRDHHHQALSLPANAHVLEQPVDVGKFIQQRHAAFLPVFAEALDAAHSTVPPSGTLTVVVTVTKEKVGNWTVVPDCVFVLLSLAWFHSFSVPWRWETVRNAWCRSWSSWSR